MGVVSWNRVLARIVRNPCPPLTTPDYYHPSFASFRRGVVLLRFSLELIGHPCSILHRMEPDIYTPPPFRNVWKNRFENESPYVCYTKLWNLFVISPVHRFILGERRWSFKRRREKTENGYRGRSKILIHNPFLPQDSLCRAIYDPLSDLNYALVSSDPPLKSNAGMKGRNARESTRAMNLANRRRPRGSSTTIVHNFHRKGKGIAISFFRSRIGYSNGNDSRVSRILEEFLFLPPRLRFVRARFRSNEGGGEEREREGGRVVVSIQMRKFRIYTAR